MLIDNITDVSYEFSQRLSLARLSSLAYCLWAKPGAYPRVEHLKGSSIGEAPALPKNKTILETHCRGKFNQHGKLLTAQKHAAGYHSTAVSYGRKQLITMAPKVETIKYNNKSCLCRCKLVRMTQETNGLV